MYDTFVGVYGISLVLFFIDAMQPRRSVNRAAVLLLFVAFLLETLFMLDRLYMLGYVPVYSPLDATLLLSWLVLLVVLCINAFFRLDIILFFVNIVGFALVVANAVSRQAAAGVLRQQGDLLAMHITSALTSYVAFCLAGVFSGMYLVQQRLLIRKRWNPLYFRLPALERLDAFAYRSILVGFPLLTLAIVLGAIWEKMTLGHYIFVDAKPLTTVIVWLLYAIYILLRAKTGWGSVALARFSIACLCVVMLNLWTAGRLSTFHHGF